MITRKRLEKEVLSGARWWEDAGFVYGRKMGSWLGLRGSRHAVLSTQNRWPDYRKLGYLLHDIERLRNRVGALCDICDLFLVLGVAV